MPIQIGQIFLGVLMAKHLKNGRSKGDGRFILIPHHVLNSLGYQATRPPARAALVELVKRYNGSNNGSIGLSSRDLARLCKISKDSAAKAIQELENVGLIETVEKGSFNRGNRRASEFRLLWLPCNLTGALPTKKYLREC
jgi:hypothetical protein